MGSLQRKNGQRDGPKRFIVGAVIIWFYFYGETNLSGNMSTRILDFLKMNHKLLKMEKTDKSQRLMSKISALSATTKGQFNNKIKKK